MARTPTQILAAIFAITSNGVPQVPDLSSHSSTGVPALTSNFLSEALTQSQQQVSEKTVRWDGAPIKDLVSLDVGKDGIVLLPVIKEGKAASIWNIEGSAFKVATLGDKKQILTTTPSDLGALSSKPFLIQEGMSSLEFQITGKGDMSSTYAKLEVSIDGGKSQTWSKLAPISSATLQPVKWDLKLLRDKNQGKDIVARVSLVDGSTSELIGVGASSTDLTNKSPAGRPAPMISGNYLINNAGKTFSEISKLIAECQSLNNYFKVDCVDLDRGDLGASKQVVYEVLRELNVCIDGRKFDHDPSSWNLLPAKLTETARLSADSTLKRLGVSITDPVKKADFDYVVSLYSIHEWFRSRVPYNIPQGEGKANIPDFRATMRSNNPSMVCGPYAWGIVHFATKAGLKDVYKVEGAARGEDTTFFGHAWNLAKTPSGKFIFCDLTSSRLTLEAVRSRSGITFSPFGFGLESWMGAFFLFNYHNQTLIGGKNTSDGDVSPITVYQGPQNNADGKDAIDQLTRIHWKDWIKFGMSTTMKRGRDWFGRDRLEAATN